MHPSTLVSSPSSSIMIFIVLILPLLLLELPSCFCQNMDSYYSACTPTFKCGSFDTMSFPFWGNGRPDYCGYPGFRLDCQGSPNVTMDIISHTYNVLGIDNSSQVIKMVSQDYAQGPCPRDFFNVTLDMTVFNCTSNVQNVTLLYNCTSSLDNNNVITPDDGKKLFRFPCSVDYQTNDAYLLPTQDVEEGSVAAECTTKVHVPVLNSAVEELLTNATNISSLLRAGFEVYWKLPDADLCKDCLASGGRCGYNSSLEKITCFCQDGESEVGACPKSNPNGPTAAPVASGSTLKTEVKAAIGVGAAFGFAGLMSIILLLYLRRYKKRNPSSTLMSRSRNAYRRRSLEHDSTETSISLGIHLFTYTQLEEATGYFADSNELGEGGFGTVYYGKLKDGREVAIKRLFESSSKWLKQYMNEVSILTRIRHKNLVTLYGCTSRHSRELLLVYEYVSNGTVADHLHGRCRPRQQQQQLLKLPWPTRLSIAVETASALVYLHASDIIHRDVKTNNILLDSNLSVKVADFGMSRLFPLDVTHVSTAPQGTPGYVDPEYHQCYHLTDKSDVYSFGVVLVELITSLAPVDITRKRNEINLSSLALNKIQNHELHEIVDASLGFESDCKVGQGIRGVAELAFRCLQNAREMRPSMEEVLDTLLSIQGRHQFDIRKPLDKAAHDVFDIPADDVVSMKGDLSTPFSPVTQPSSSEHLSA